MASSKHEKKRVVGGVDDQRWIMDRIDKGEPIAWSTLWSRTVEREVEDEREKDGLTIVQLAYVLRDHYGRVGLYRRADTQDGQERHSKGCSILGGRSLINDQLVSGHPYSFRRYYPNIGELIPDSSIIGGFVFAPLGVGYSITASATKPRTYIFVVYCCTVRVAGYEVAPTPQAPQSAARTETDVFLGLMPIAEARARLLGQAKCLAMDLAVLDGLQRLPISKYGDKPHRQVRLASTVLDLRALRGNSSPRWVRIAGYWRRNWWLSVALPVLMVALGYLVTILDVWEKLRQTGP